MEAKKMKKENCNYSVAKLMADSHASLRILEQVKVPLLYER